jgi:crotonobetainyl-CoA:carnitine CoA-transferase CaiB-like acyl-CoA transferase
MFAALSSIAGGSLMPSALHGLRVLDLTHGMAGPLAGMMMADNGAEVIKLDPPGGPRISYPPGDIAWNRGKKSVHLDLKSTAGLANFLRLADTADILLESFRPGVTKRLGIDYAQLSRRNPRLVYTSITGYGSTGRLANRPGYEALVQARTGFQSEQPLCEGQPSVKRSGPILIGVPYVSIGAFFMAIYGTLAALDVRERTGEGQMVETALFLGAMANYTMNWWGAEKYQVHSPGSWVNGERIPWLPTIYESKDGVWFFGMGTRRFKDEFAKALDMKEGYMNVPLDVPIPRQREIYWELYEAYKKKTWKELEEIFTKTDCIWLPVQETPQAFDDDQVQHNKFIVTVDDPKHGRLRQVGVPFTMEKTPPKVQGPAPLPGRDTAKVLAAIPPAPSLAKAALRGRRNRLALEHVKVLDMGDFLAGPLGPQLLADLGADVIKLERTTGDPMRHAWAFYGCQRGKRAIAVDLYSPEGQQIAYKLAAEADIVHHNWRPGVAERLKVDYQTMKRYNPNVIYCHNVPFGFTGPKAERGGLDQIMQAYSGALRRDSGRGNPPTTWLRSGLCDYVQAMMGGLAMLLALYHRERTGEGQFVGSRMLDAALWIHSDVSLGGRNTPTRPDLDSNLYGFGPLYRLYETSEGWICLAAVQEKDWQGLCKAIGQLDLVKDGRFATPEARGRNADALAGRLERAFKERTAEEWLKALDAHDVPAEISKVHYGYDGVDLPKSAEARENGWLVEYQHAAYGKMWQAGIGSRLSKTPGQAVLAPPILGQHTREILAAAGYSQQAIADLKARGVINWAEPG